MEWTVNVVISWCSELHGILRGCCGPKGDASAEIHNQNTNLNCVSGMGIAFCLLSLILEHFFVDAPALLWIGA